MYKLPKFSKLPKIKLAKFKINFKKIKIKPRKIKDFLLAHRISMAVFIFLILVIGVLIESRNNFVSQMKNAQKTNFSPPPVSYSRVTESIETAFTTVVSPAPSVLGVSTEETSYVPTPIYYPKPVATPIYKPTPTSAPIVVNFSATPPPSTPSNSSAHNCSTMGVSPGVPTAWYSQASLPQTVGNTATITIELRDCNDNIASVSDTLTITQSSGVGTTVNGSSPPISIEANNGKASFTVKASISGTAVYIVRDTTKSFNVTDPNNKHPQVTFSISTPASTPTPSPSVVASPTAAPSPVISPSPTSSDTPTTTPTPSPGPI